MEARLSAMFQEACLPRTRRHEMARAIGATMQITLFSGALDFFAPWRSRNVAHARGQRVEDRVKMLHDFLFATNHHAVTAFQAPNAAAGSHVHIMNALCRQFFSTTDVINVV